MHETDAPLATRCFWMKIESKDWCERVWSVGVQRCGVERKDLSWSCVN